MFSLTGTRTYEKMIKSLNVFASQRMELLCVVNCLNYHKKSKHSHERFADGPARINWANQPCPYRRYETAIRVPLLPYLMKDLHHIRMDGLYTYPEMSVPLGLPFMSTLLYYSLSLSAKKSYGGSRWYLRVNPSSGNLHPTEAYVLFEGVLYHYLSETHSLEVRGPTPTIMSPYFQNNSFFIGLTSAFCRESWKYGVRAFRYCQLDIGHAIASVALAACMLGFRARIIPIQLPILSSLLGIQSQSETDGEWAECLIGLIPCDSVPTKLPLLDALNETDLAYHKYNDDKPNDLWRSGYIYGDISSLARCIFEDSLPWHYVDRNDGNVQGIRKYTNEAIAPKIIRQRRSAQNFDKSVISRTYFPKLIHNLLSAHSVYNCFTWENCVNLIIAIHNIEDMASGLYFLLRDDAQIEELKSMCLDSFVWEKTFCNDLYFLKAGDYGRLMKMISCNQDIARDGSLTVCMVTNLKKGLRKYGPIFYNYSQWECGSIGQILYNEAEAIDMRGVGIGCFIDDGVMEMMGENFGNIYKSLYHFAIGKPLLDKRIKDLDVYL